MRSERAFSSERKCECVHAYACTKRIRGGGRAGRQEKNRSLTFNNFPTERTASFRTAAE